ncbi:MAG: hypothetical protein ABSD28_03890 [Tepidisphaeraceae bacterium]
MADDSDAMPLPTNRRHDISTVLMAANMPMISDVVHGILGQSSRVGNRQLPPGGEELEGNAGRGDGLLDGIFTPFTRKTAELDFCVGLDGGHNFQKIILPITGCLRNSTHGTLR